MTKSSYGLIAARFIGFEPVSYPVESHGKYILEVLGVYNAGIFNAATELVEDSQSHEDEAPAGEHDVM